ncbi:MAG: P-loop NTPase fold protein [Treponema sp.]|nr:P-loop NTPase fold protein [Treponema sp.]
MQQDHLSRQPFIDLLKNIIANQSANSKGYSIAIDGEWGSGKTWVLNELENQLDKAYLVFHYNAWQNDFYEEPLVAILSILISSLQDLKTLNEKNGNTKIISKSITTLLKLAGSIVEKKWGINPSEIFESTKDLTVAISDKKLTKEDFNSLLPLENTLKVIKEVLNDISKKYKIILIVDELDRCLPEYAIKVLERLHHVCNEMLVFQIIAINKRDLSFGIAKVFGMNNPNIDIEKFADKYLQKFIQLTIPLNNGQISNEEDILSGINEGFTPAIAIDKNYLIQFYQQLMNGIPPRTQEYLKQQVTLIHKLTVLSGHTLEEYSYGLLCCELMYCIKYLVFKNHSDFIVNHDEGQKFLLDPNLDMFDKCQIITSNQFSNNLNSIFTGEYVYYADFQSDWRVNKNELSGFKCNSGAANC